MTVCWQSGMGNTIQNIHAHAITDLLASTVNEMMDVTGGWGSSVAVHTTLG